VCGFVLLWSLTILSLEHARLAAPYPVLLRRRHIVVVCTAIWLFSSLMILPVPLYFSVEECKADRGGVVSICTAVFPPTSQESSISVSITLLLPIVLLGMIVPLGLLTLNYSRLVKVINSPEKLRCGKVFSIEESSSSLRVSTNANTKNNLSEDKRDAILDEDEINPYEEILRQKRLYPHSRSVRKLIIEKAVAAQEKRLQKRCRAVK
ncbi:unnamed protein product, partial [Meganyctiphanes norvegica]